MVQATLTRPPFSTPRAPVVGQDQKTSRYVFNCESSKYTILLCPHCLSFFAPERKPSARSTSSLAWILINCSLRLTNSTRLQLSPEELEKSSQPSTTRTSPKRPLPPAYFSLMKNTLLCKPTTRAYMERRCVSCLSSSSAIFHQEKRPRSSIPQKLRYLFHTGQRRRGDRQDQTNPPRGTLPGDCTTRPSKRDGGKTGRLSEGQWLLKVTEIGGKRV